MSGGWRRAAGGWRLRDTGLSALLALLGLLVGAGPVAAQVEVVEYYATDAVGSVRVVFNANGQVVARADYQPFGELFAPVGELPPQQFTGQARDGEAGLDYFGARFYQPRHGRFTQVDPVYAGLFDPQQWNRYTYARANPLSFVDPDGRQIVDCRDVHGRVECSTSAFVTASFLRADMGGAGGAAPASGHSGCADNGSRAGCGGAGGAGGGPGWLETIRDVADVISVVDPTQLSNAVSAVASLGMGEVGTAAITAAGAVPILGKSIDAARGATAIGRVLNGQRHHVISRTVHNALEQLPSLKGHYSVRDPRFVTRAVDGAAHRGYQTWHRQLDGEVAAWIDANPSATTSQFESYLRNRYGRPDLASRFPNGF